MHEPQLGSVRWHRTFQIMLRTVPTPLVVPVARRVQRLHLVELLVVGRRTGRERRTLLTLFVIDGYWYVGHPNGRSQWVRNLAAATSAIVLKGGERSLVRPVELPIGPERDTVVEATSEQPFPAGLLFRAARAHVSVAGTYFRLERNTGASA